MRLIKVYKNEFIQRKDGLYEKKEHVLGFYTSEQKAAESIGVVQPYIRYHRLNHMKDNKFVFRGYTFEYIDNKEKLALPLLYNSFFDI